jgi:hypothetical protein
MRAKFLASRRFNLWLFVSVVVLVAGLGGLMAACGATPAQPALTTATAAAPSSATSTTREPSTISTAATATTLPPTPSTTVPVAKTESVVKAFMAAWNSSWDANSDHGVLNSLFSQDVEYYDATLSAVITKADIDGMVRDPNWWKSFQLKERSYFVSSDGRFAATLGTIAIRDSSGNLPWQPSASVHAFGNGKIVWEYDYYGGEPGKSRQTEQPLTIPPSVVEPGSPAAQTAIAEATATLEKWLAAYNGRDATAFLSFYAEQTKYVDVVSPEWRVMTKSDLAADVSSRFSRSEFQSKIEPAYGSAMTDSFFVSADGRFAAVQGSYQDTGTGSARPMLLILELQDGKIVGQYNFIAMDKALLQP